MKHSTSPAIDGGNFASIPQAPSSYAPSNFPTSVTPVAAAKRRRPGSPSHDISNVPTILSRRDRSHIGRLRPVAFQRRRDRMHRDELYVNTDLSLWTPVLTEDARCQAFY